MQHHRARHNVKDKGKIMAIGSIGVRTTAVAATVAQYEIRTTAAVRATVLELGIITATAATSQQVGLGRPQAIGVTPTTPVLFQRDEPGAPACVTTTALAWATGPTIPLVFHRKWTGAATVGVGIIWTFPRGLVIPVSSSLIVWSITTTPGNDINAVIDE